MSLNASELSFSKFLDVQVAIEFQAHRIAICMRIENGAMNRTNVIPFLFITNPEECGLVGLNGFNPPPAILSKYFRRFHQIAIRDLVG